MKTIFKLWLSFFFLLTIITGGVYIITQQVYRQSANDPQAAMANDIANELTNGSPVTISHQVDISKTQQPFTMVFNKDGTVATSEALLHNNIPVVPAGVFVYTRGHGTDRFTWEPEPQVRIATVVTAYPNGFVLVGRSLSETENRETQLERQIFLFWFGGNSIMLAVCTALWSGGKKNI